MAGTSPRGFVVGDIKGVVTPPAEYIFLKIVLLPEVDVSVNYNSVVGGVDGGLRTFPRAA